MLNRSRRSSLAVRWTAVTGVAAAALLAGCQGSGQHLPEIEGRPAANRWPQNPVAIVNGVVQPAPAIPGHPAVIRAILSEGLSNNRVMDHLRALSDIGPRLTGSSNVERAGLWAAEQFRSFGLAAQPEQWGTIATRFDRLPSKGIVLTEDRPERPRRREGDAAPSDEPPPAPTWKEARSLEFTWLAWTRGTQGPVRGPVVRLPASDQEYDTLKAAGKLQGAWVLIPPPPPAGQRGVRDRLRTMYEARIDARAKVAKGEVQPAAMPVRERLIFDGIAGFIGTSRDERVWTGGISGWDTRAESDIPPDVHAVVRLSDYDFINSRLQDGEGVQVELDMACQFTPGPIPTYNVVAEIPGTSKADEVVIVSAHLDSWDGPGSHGIVDNGTGSSVTIEAARLLSAALARTGQRPLRTIRFILWTGEEQGLLGSKAYVARLKQEGTLDKVSVVIVDDGGTNYQGGLGAADVQVEMLAAATAPITNQFYDATDGTFLNVNVQGMGKSIRTHGGSDHASFNQEGIPGFFWDEVGRADYQYAWHTQHDQLDQAIPTYLAQSSTNSAITAYNLAMAPTPLPRGEPAQFDRQMPRGPTPPAGVGTPPAAPSATPGAGR